MERCRRLRRYAPVEAGSVLMNKGLAAVLAGSAVVGAQLAGRQYSPTPDHPRTAAWYASLRKPSYTPPGPVFGVAWTFLDALYGYSGFRLLSARPTGWRAAALAAWAINVLGIGGFSWVLFGRKQLDEATGVTAGMLAASIAGVATATRVDRRAAWAGVPLAAWVAFASLLQEEVWRRNA